MYLRQIEIEGFRGIKQLSLDLNSSANVFIGENRWGRSSLISVLMLMSLDKIDYQFIESDFFIDEQHQANEVIIRFTFVQTTSQELSQECYKPLIRVSYQDDNSQSIICYEIIASKQKSVINTTRSFVDMNNSRIVVADQPDLINLLIELNPMIQLKNPISPNDEPNTNQPLSDYYTNELLDKLHLHMASSSNNEIEQGIAAAKALLEYYLVNDKQTLPHSSNKKETLTVANWGSLERINTFLDNLDDTYIKTALIGIFIALLAAKGNHKLHPSAMPIIILEEPENKLHPIILSICFRLLKNFPTQKFYTTNSSDFISLFSLEHIYHIIRKPSQLLAMHIGHNKLNTGDSRRILFHVLYRRPSAMFARCWFLVEGETEIWLLRELAELSGYHLASEGVQLLEFAQCGLKPLIKYADKMGIQWYVLTDGDMAGKKYAATVSSLCSEEEDIKQHLTVLPTLDIEHFLFKNGFSNVYKIAAYGSNDFINTPIKHIIQKAINRSSKPDLAIAICDEIRKRGSQSVPHLLQQMFDNIIQLSSRFDNL